MHFNVKHLLESNVSPRRSSSLQSVSNPAEKINKMDQCPVSTEPPAFKERPDVTVTSSTHEEVDLDTVEIEVDV